MRHKNTDLIVSLIIVVLNAGWACIPNATVIVGTILALPLVFVLPGYVLTEVLSYKRSLSVAHHLTFSLGLSLAIDIVGGFILNVLPMGLQAITWVAILGLLTTVLS